MVSSFNAEKGQIERTSSIIDVCDNRGERFRFNQQHPDHIPSGPLNHQLNWERQELLRMQLERQQQVHDHYGSHCALLPQQQHELPLPFHTNPPAFDTRQQSLSPAGYSNDLMMHAYYVNQLEHQLQNARDAERYFLSSSYGNCGAIPLQNSHHQGIPAPQQEVGGRLGGAPPLQETRGQHFSLQQQSTNRLCRSLEHSQHRPTVAEDYTRPKHYLCRPVMSLKVENGDGSWLTPFLCFLRKDCLELFEAEQCDVYERKTSKQVVLHQVGVRCRFCAHLEHGERIQRSSMFPSKIDGIYTSLPVLIRNHLSLCPEMPKELRTIYASLKGSSKRDGLETKSYWRDSAQSLGLVERENGIFFRWRQC